ncbi:MAG: hypothetical protein LBQ12_14620, partial [Deltaproteobacteria bacterium]|nr:hypothetical protein [Deltaproteobacteria bacterium]
EARLVLTGVTARRRPDGRFDCLGLSADGGARQAAARLRAAERRLLESPGVLDARVWLSSGKASAAVAMYPPLSGPDKAALEKALQRRLAPELPVGTGPARVAAVAEFPLDASGEVELKLLAAPAKGPAAAQPQGKSGDPASGLFAQEGPRPGSAPSGPRGGGAGGAGRPRSPSSYPSPSPSRSPSPSPSPSRSPSPSPSPPPSAPPSLTPAAGGRGGGGFSSGLARPGGPGEKVVPK